MIANVRWPPETIFPTPSTRSPKEENLDGDHADLMVRTRRTSSTMRKIMITTKLMKKMMINMMTTEMTKIKMKKKMTSMIQSSMMKKKMMTKMMSFKNSSEPSSSSCVPGKR